MARTRFNISTSVIQGMVIMSAHVRAFAKTLHKDIYIFFTKIACATFSFTENINYEKNNNSIFNIPFLFNSWF